MYQETADDLNKKYAHTWAFHNGRLTYFDAFGGEPVHVSCATGDGQTCLSIPVGTIEPIVINEMFINNGKFTSKGESPAIPLTHFQRSPKRQWKRGLSRDNTRITSPFTQVCDSLGHRPTWDGKISFKLIGHLLEPHYPTWEEAIKLLPTYQAIALSPLFAIMLSNVSEDYFLIANTFGFVAEAKENIIKVRHEAALQEIRDWCVRSGQKLTVEMDSAFK